MRWDARLPGVYKEIKSRGSCPQAASPVNESASDCLLPAALFAGGNDRHSHTGDGQQSQPQHQSAAVAGGGRGGLRRLSGLLRRGRLAGIAGLAGLHGSGRLLSAAAAALAILVVVAQSGDSLRLGIGVLLALEGDLGGVGPHAIDLTGGLGGHLVGNSSVHRLHMGGIIAASEGGRSGEIIVPLPHRGAIGMTGGRDGQLLQRCLGIALGIAEQLAADLALPVGLHTGGLAGGRYLCHGGQGMTGGGNGLGLAGGILLILEGDLSGIGPYAGGLASGGRGDSAGHLCRDVFHMGGIVSASKGGRSGEIIVPLPHRLTVSMAGGGDSQLLQRRLGLALGIAEQLAADGADPVGLSCCGGSFAGRRTNRNARSKNFIITGSSLCCQCTEKQCVYYGRR